MSEPTPDTSTQGALVRSLQNMPWQVQALFLAAMTFGVPVPLIGFYLAREAGWIENPIVVELRAVEGELEEIKGLLVRHDHTTQAMQMSIEGQRQQLEEQAKRWQLRCVLRSKTEQEKRACFPTVQP